MLDLCSEHHLTADVEVLPIHLVNEAYDRLPKADVKYRFSIDLASLKSEERGIATRHEKEQEMARNHNERFTGKVAFVTGAAGAGHHVRR